MPNRGTATNTQSASATVVDSEPVGGSYPGRIVHRLAVARKRKSVPRKPRYFSGWGKPTSSICFSIPVTTISRRFCHRERFWSVESLRVTSFEPTARMSISPQVNTMVPLSFRNPRCQKIIWSGLRRMGCLLCRWSRQTNHSKSGSDEPEETQQQSLPMAAREEVESSRDNGYPQHQAAKDPKRGAFGVEALANCPPKAAEEDHAQHRPEDPGQG